MCCLTNLTSYRFFAVLVAVAVAVAVAQAPYDDGDGNRNGKKARVLDWQKNNFARASRFFAHFSTVIARLQRETAKFHVLSRTGKKDNNFLFHFLNFDAVL